MALALRVALDATPLSVPTGGIHRYTAELVSALAALYPDDEYWLVSDQPFELPVVSANVQRGARPGNPLARRWWTLGLPRELRRLGAQVFHGTDFSVPYLPACPAVVTIHDLSPWRAGTAEFTSDRVRRRTPLLIGLGLTTMIITPSRTIRHEVIERFHTPPDRVVAIPLAASPMFRPVPTAVRERPYFLCVGTRERRKNLRVVVDAWHELRRDVDVDLIIAGRAGSDAKTADPDVCTGPIPDAQLPPLYSGALAFLFPSLYEGFGLPALEAMQCGAMVIASKDPAVSEVVGDAAVQIDAGDSRGWLAAMRAAMVEERRGVWRERALVRAAAFSWERTAKMTREVYDEASHLS